MEQQFNNIFASLLTQLQDNNQLYSLVQKSQLVSSLVSKEDKQVADQHLKNFESYLDEQLKQIKDSQQELALQQTIKPTKVKRLYVDGCFDLMHSGHYNALRQAKSLTETLVVGVISQEEVTKRKGTPILRYPERLQLAQSCKYVDEIHEHAPYDASIELLDQLNCTHIAHGDDLIITPDGKDAYAPFKEANRMLTEGISTTDVVGRLLLMSKSQVDPELKTKMRKLSGDQGVQASKLQESDCQTVLKEQKQDDIQITQVKMLNTTRRIRQFSSDHKEPTQDDKIIYIDGSFDLLHPGHLTTLRNAKKLGTYLIAGIHDDETVNSIKGNNYPILSLQERVLNVLANSSVDEVIIGAPWKLTEQIIKQFDISLVVEGSLTKGKEDGQQETKEGDDPYEVAKKLGVYKQIQSESDMNTDTIIQRIVDNRLQYLQIYNKKAKKQQDYYDTTERKVQEC